MNITDFLIAFVSLLILVPTLQAQENPKYSLTDDSRLWIKGDATLHSWDAEATEFEIDFLFPDEWFESTENWSGEDVEQLSVTVPVKALDGGRSRMNRDLREAMDEESYPTITFYWEEIDIQHDEDQTELIVTGILEVSGVEKEIEFAAEGQVIEEDSFKISGEIPLKMTNFNIDPPTAMLGSLRTDDEIKILYEMIFERKN